MNQTITNYELGTKAKSKSEVCRLLSIKGKVYLPPASEANHNFISDVISGKLKVCKIL